MGVSPEARAGLRRLADVAGALGLLIVASPLLVVGMMLVALTDGGLLEAPVRIDRIQLSPGERAEIVERRKQPAVAQRPVVATPHPGACDAHPGSEDDQQVGERGSKPGDAAEWGHGARNLQREGERRQRDGPGLTARARRWGAPCKGAP